MKLTGKVAIVTGATKGIGKACAEEMANEGALVVLTGRSTELGEAAAVGIRSTGAEALYVPCDVSDGTQVRQMVAKAVAHFGRVDILVNNAGINLKGEFLDLTEADFDSVITTNLKGYFLVGQAVARQMVAQGHGGVIINMSSIMAELALSNQVAYCASKGGIRQLTKSMALSLQQYNIRVNAIGPGPVLTELMQRVAFDKAQWDVVMSRTPKGRFAECREIGRVAVFLASDDADFIFGETIYVDGGRLVQGLHEPLQS